MIFKIRKGHSYYFIKMFIEVIILLEFLQAFLSDIMFFILHITNSNSFPKPLNAKEEKEYLDKYKSGDRTARSMLIEHNLRLVAHIVKKYYSETAEQNDLISIGTIGLIKAIDSFDESKGIRLSSYAARCVENEILMYFRSKKKNAQDISLSEPIDTDKDGNVMTILDTMTSDDDIVEMLDAKIKSEQLKKYVDSTLSPRERMVVVLRYGLYGGRPLAQREVADKLCISRSYVSRIEKHAIDILRKNMDK